jgi:hypothetical protein
VANHDWLLPTERIHHRDGVRDVALDRRITGHGRRRQAALLVARRGHAAVELVGERGQVLGQARSPVEEQGAGLCVCRLAQPADDLAVGRDG